MAKTQDFSLIGILIPFSIVLFIIGIGVVMLYLQYRKKIVQKEFERLAMKSSQQQELLEATLMAQEEERKRIAADIHDEIGATVSMIKMNLALLRQQSPGTGFSPGNPEILSTLISLSESAIASVRQISHQLMPPQLEAFGLIKTLESFQNAINKAGTISFEIEQLNEDFPELPWSSVLHLYRTIMELINNTIRHAGATAILITFEYKNGRLHISYRDNGSGIDTRDESKAVQGKGFKTIQTRIDVLRGVVAYPHNDAAPGFRADIKIPVD